MTDNILMLITQIWGNCLANTSRGEICRFADELQEGRRGKQYLDSMELVKDNNDHQLIELERYEEGKDFYLYSKRSMSLNIEMRCFHQSPIHCGWIFKWKYRSHHNSIECNDPPATLFFWHTTRYPVSNFQRSTDPEHWKRSKSLEKGGKCRMGKWQILFLVHVTSISLDTCQKQ